MRLWQHRLMLKDLLSAEDDSEAVAKAAVGMHARLESFRICHFPVDDDLEMISDQFHTIAYIDGPAGAADVIEFNMVLSDLYDWADRDKRLWIY